MLENKGYLGLEALFHLDQGKVYSSISFNNEYNNYNITRSMSKIATSTDNLIIESNNGWLNRKMLIDFN